MDEISCSAPTTICELRDGYYRTSVIAPEELGIQRCEKADVVGGSAQENAEITKAILAGEERGPKRDIVLLNAGAALFVAGAAETIADGVRLAAETIDSGAAERAMQAYIAESNK